MSDSELSPHEDDAAALVDRICDEFESQWQTGQRPDIEACVASVVEALRERLTSELLRSEILLRATLGELPTRQDYERRFPDRLDVIEEAWISAARIQKKAAPNSKSYKNETPANTDLTIAWSDSSRHESSAAIDIESAGEAASRESNSWIGKRLGVYRLVAEIARGGMGVVYKAVDERLHRTVAIKMILGGQFASPEAVRRFQLEARAAAALDHSGSVPIHEVNAHENAYYYVMSYVDGMSLADRLKAGPLPPLEAAELILTVAEAVGCAHQHQIVHRDLKPGNILIDSEGNPRVTDFGLAKRCDDLDQLTMDGQVLGTPGYMAPEQAAGKSSDCTPATDVYALGAVLYESLCGRPPFDAVSYAEAIELVQEEPAPPPRQHRPEIPRDLETICLKCLNKSPYQRYPNASELADDLRRFLHGERILARPLALWDRVGQWARQRPALATTWVAMSCFYLYHLMRLYLTREVAAGSGESMTVTTTVLGWSLAAWGYQRLLGVNRWNRQVLYAWAATDVLILTLFLLRFDGPSSSYVMGYFVLTAGAALRFRVRLVWLVTGLSVVGYFVLLFDALLRRPDKLPEHHTSIAMFLVGILTIGIVQGLLLVRVRRQIREQAGGSGSNLAGSHHRSSSGVSASRKRVWLKR
ncbi:MAG: serine/threonine protein kinase [Planctomycetales bacterium]|nr:serine/threonine protein kinase [Planctomycetales bacterium]